MTGTIEGANGKYFEDLACLKKELKTISYDELRAEMEAINTRLGATAFWKSLGWHIDMLEIFCEKEVKAWESKYNDESEDDVEFETDHPLKWQLLAALLTGRPTYPWGKKTRYPFPYPKGELYLQHLIENLNERTIESLVRPYLIEATAQAKAYMLRQQRDRNAS